MAGADYFIGQNDHGESLSDTLQDSTGAAVDISGATVTLTVAPIGGGAAIINAANATNDQNGNGSDGSKGKVHYVWQAADTAADGLYLGRWNVAFGGGAAQSYPNGGYLLIEITPVAAAALGVNYITVEQLKASLSLTGMTFADADLKLGVAAASRAIDELTGRRFYPDTVDVARKFLPLNSGYCIIDDLSVFTSLTFQGETWTIDQDFYLEPTNAAPDGRPWTSIRAIARPFVFTLADISPGWAAGFDGRITVTGRWGWASTPPQIQEAAGLLASRLMRRAREAPFAVIGSGIEGEAVRLAKFDPDVAMLVDPFTKTVIV